MNNRPLIIAILVFIVLTIVALLFSLILTNFNFSYGLDDAYIHLSLTRNLLNHHLWGINQQVFASVSSSPAWDILLTVIGFFIPTTLLVYVPFLFNVICQILIILLIYRWCLKMGVQKNILTFSLVLLVLITPFIALSLGGMEHSLHILLVLVFLFSFLDYFVLKQYDTQTIARILIFASLATFTRYETLFLIAICCLLLCWKKLFSLAGGLILASCSLISIFGLVSMVNGNFFLPNPLLVKSISEGQSFVVIKIIVSIVVAWKNLIFSFKPHYNLPLIILLLLNLYLLKKNRRDDLVSTTAFIFLMTAILHISFAKLYWLFRYEAYLIVLGILPVILTFSRSFVFLSRPLFLSVLLIIFLPRIVFGAIFPIMAAKNIYEQQVQVGRFFNLYDNKAYVAYNDLGAITFFSDIKILDLAGLASKEILLKRIAGQASPSNLNDLIRKEEVDWVVLNGKESGLLSDYALLGGWKINYNRINGSDTIYFYLKNNITNYNEKVAAFKSFMKRSLPKTVVVDNLNE